MKIYYYAYTCKGNLGDLLITKFQIEEFAKHTEVFVDCHGMPSNFRDAIFDTQSSNIKDFEREFGIGYRSINILRVISILNRQGFTHFCYSPGPRVPLRMPLHTLCFKLVIHLIPYIFLSKRIKRYAVGVDLNYNHKGVIARLNKWLFSQIDVLGIRSQANYNSLKGEFDNVMYVPDMAFLCPKYSPSLFKTKRNRIALSFREVEDKDNLMRILHSIGSTAKQKELEVDILYQVEQDESFCKQLTQELNHPNVHFIEKILGFYDLDIYQKYDIVFSNRLHVLLLAAMNGAIPYGIISHNRKENKINEIFNSVFKHQFVSYLDGFEEDIISSLLNDSNAIKKEICACVKEQRELCMTAISQLSC